ncbi:MAG: hypothetical protein Crog4KO_06840 [Crocinitomicaceae bacterium]
MLLTSSVFGQGVTEDQKKRANELFENEQYVEATPLYLQMLSLEPEEADWNFKYGACLLFNSGDKKEAIRYLKYGVNTEGTDSRVFYFYGKALHLDYQFSAAKRFYQKYQSKRDKPDKRYPVEREIQMCDNGKRLLSTFTDIIVTDKTQIDQERFYDIYNKASIVSGSITVNRDFQSKLDKKKGHVPVVHITPSSKIIFYSSWGDDESTGKDIYMRIRLPDKSWGKPQPVRGGVNSIEDEDYPFMHSSGRFLYFSSKGHNSMGGYDVFMCRFDQNTNTFGPPENVDFAISSPDDDLFYIVDSSFSNAYFASARSSEKDKIHVYNVKVVRVPIQEIIVMGNFRSDIKPEDQKISLQIQKNSNGDDLVTMPVTASKGGRYSYVFPKGGKYDYVIDVEGSDIQYKFTVELPFLDEFRPLKQEIIHTTEDGNEVIRIINKFDESVEGAEAIIAEVIRKKSELEVNVDQFDLEALEIQNNLDGLLAELEFDNMSLGEVSNQLLELQNAAENNEEITERIKANVASEMLAKTARIKELDQMEKELRASAEKATDPVTKHKLLTEASQKQQEKELLMDQVAGLEELITDVNKLGETSVDPENIKKVQEKFESLRGEDEAGALEYLVSEKAIINQAKASSPNQIKDEYTKDIVEKRKEIQKISSQRDEYRNTVENIKSKINTLEREREGARKKEQERIDEEIASLESELAMLDDEIERISGRIVTLERELDATEERLASYQNAVSTEEKSEVDPTEIAEAKQAVADIATEETFNYDAALTSLETDHPEINGGDPIVDFAAEIDQGYNDQKEAIKNDTSLSPLEQASRLVENNDNAREEVEETLTQVRKKLEDGEDERLREQEAALLKQQEELQEENAGLVAEEQRLKAETPDAALSKEDVLSEIAPNIGNQLAEVESDPSRTELEKLTEKERILEELGADLEEEASQLEEAINQNPNDEEARAKQELVRQLITDNDQAIATNKAEIDALPEPTVTEMTTAEAIASVDEDYATNKAQILANDGPRLNQEKEVLELNEELLEDLEKEANKVSKNLQKNPEDLDLLAKQEGLNKAIATIESQIAENNQNILAFSNTSTPTVSSEEVLAEIAPNYQEDRASIQNGTGTPVEKQAAFKSLEEETLADLEKARNKAQKRADRNPEDASAQARVAAIDAAIQARQTEISTIDKRIAAINNTSTPTEISTEEILAEVAPDLDNDLSEVENSDGTASDKARRKASVVAGALEILQREREETKKQLDRNPDNQELEARVSALDKTISEQQEVLSQLEASAVSNLTAQEKEEVIASTSPSYSYLPSTSTEAQIELEQQLQSDLEKEIGRKDKELKREYSVAVSIEKAILEKLLNESKEREADISGEEFLFPVLSELLGSLRGEGGTESGGNIDEALSNTYDNLADLEEQDRQLAVYESLLETKIEENEALVAKDPSVENKDVLELLRKEKESVSEKRRSISVSIGALEQTALTTNNSNPEVQELKREEDRIREAQNAEDLSNSERKQLSKDLEEVSEKRYAIENEEVRSNLGASKAVSETLQDDLENRAASEDNIAGRTLAHAEVEENAIATIEEAAETAKSEAERNYLLNQASKRREALNKDLQEAVVASELADLEEEFDIATASRADLEKQKRSYTIQVGEITREIEKVNQEMSEAKRKDLPELEARRADLITQKEQVEARLERVNSQLSQVEEQPTALNTNALKEAVSFNEERQIAASEEFENYQIAAVEALSVANEIRKLEEELGEKRKELQRAVQNREPEATIREKAQAVQALEEELDRKQIELTQKKYTADQALPENEEQAMKMQNLVARGIQPLKITAAAAAIIQMPTTGFAIDTSSEKPNNGAIEIPVGVANPEGLVYRVQVGAFARPLRSDVFKEFNPVSGEKIDGTNITRYMAGYFSSSETVVQARQQIRNLGYSDAFVVAYCNGERITLGEARRREAAGICVPKRAEEIMIEVAQNTAKNLNIPISTEPEEVPEWSYAKAPGAVDSDPIEQMEGLFFTVQIGVFNRAVTSAELKNMPSVSTFRLPNGQIRYNTGMFDSAEDALPRQSFARSSGIQGAFIVAYYQGKRISIGNARRLLLEYGNSILQSRMEKTPEVVETNQVRTDSVRRDVIEIAPMEEWEKRVQIVTEETFDEFPRDVLNRYNAEGSFYFDEKDKRVKSTIYENEDYLPNLFNFQDDVDTIYLDEGLLADQRTETVYFAFSDSLVPGAFMDWMLRCNYRREINRTSKGTEVRIFGVAKEDMDSMFERIRLFGVEPDKIKEEE